MATLSQHRKRPTLAPLSIADSPLPLVVAKYHDCRNHLEQVDTTTVAHPETDAIEFYLKNAAMAKITQLVQPDEPLGKYEPLVESYHDTVRAKSLRMFYYLLLICTRESRHLHNSPAFWEYLKTLYPVSLVSFTQSIKGTGSDTAVSKLLKHAPDVGLGVYADYLFAVFDKGADNNLFASGYGGKAWASVAKVLRGFTNGVLSAELMLDTAFTLAHNNGPIFNKQLLYHQYDLHELLRVLDVQRAGMMPQFVWSVSSQRISHKAKSFCVDAKQLLEGFYGDVDWAKVEALGAVQSYAAEKAAAAKALKVGAALAVPGVVLKKVVVKRAA